MDTITELAVKEVSEKYNPHTIIVYGSRARGEATHSSDVDIACFTESKITSKDARIFHNVFLDAWIYPEEDMIDIKDEFLRFNDGYCALDNKGLGAPFLQKIQHKIDQGPEQVSDEEKVHTREWVSKMLIRVSESDIEANYRRSWLQFELLEIYFQLRGLWYFGPKKSFNWLKTNDPIGYQLFENAYSNPLNHIQLKELASYAISVE